MTTWPSILPGPVFDGYTLGPSDQVIRTDIENAPVRTRRRTSAANDAISLQWLFTEAQMTIFRAWFDDPNNAAGGAAWFDVSLPDGYGGLNTVSAKFSGPWSATPTEGMNWTVSGKLDTRAA